MVKQHYRWDFIGLSTDSKPTPATNENVADGSTFYCSDNSKLYVFYKDTWYEKKPIGGSGDTGNYVEKVGDTSEYPFDDQRPYLVTDDHLAYDVESVSIGQLVYDTSEVKLYVVSGTDIDPDTGDEYILWLEIGGI